MDIVLRQMMLSHELWYIACCRAFGPDDGALVYLMTARFMTLPERGAL